MTTAARPRPTRAAILGAWMLVAGVMLAAFNFRTAVTSVGAMLSEIQDGLGMSETVAGLLTTLPVLAFASLGALAPRLTRRFGARGVITASLLAMSLGLIARAYSGHAALFLLFSLLALAGGAIGNVAVPVIVKRYFPHSIGRMTTAYTAMLAIGTTIPAFATVPIAQLAGDWRLALAAWSVPALLAVVPWLVWRDGDGRAAASEGPRLRGVWRSPLAWAMLVAFGTQSSIAYIVIGWVTEFLRTRGMDAASAGAMLGVFTLVQIPMFMIVPLLVARPGGPRPVFLSLAVCYPIGVGGLWVFGGDWSTWIWSALTAVASATFPLLLTLFGLRARTAGGTAALSGFAQSGGYLLAGVGPLAVGWLYGLTSAWALPFGLLFVLIGAQMISGLYLTRDRYIEDQLPHSSPRSQRSPWAVPR
ncbi:CynX/NimT family MFS transporter [Glycomyces xiaoerkulensis]|uniref:CynX/NimT family MFS transporter n=1 Tax=Glycomyces xiaoerkulensis TaxID=2038139 RepID=UPI001E2EF9D0|nr:MFS transporter [Glycomyces xiaoerkulensis]